MVKLVVLKDAGEDPVFVNPALVTHVARPALEVFGNATIHFVGGASLTVKEHPADVVASLLAAAPPRAAASART